MDESSSLSFVFILQWKYLPHFSISLILFCSMAESSHTLLLPLSTTFHVVVSLLLLLLSHFSRFQLCATS